MIRDIVTSINAYVETWSICHDLLVSEFMSHVLFSIAINYRNLNTVGATDHLCDLILLH